MKTSNILLRSRNYAAYDQKFTTKTGWLNDYALSCGYIHLIESQLNSDRRVRLEKYGTSGYAVFTTIENRYYRWTYYNNIKAARKVFLILAKIIIREEVEQ